MTTWADVRGTLSQAVADAVGWSVPARAGWDSEPAVSESVFARLTAVSSFPEGERAPQVDTDTLARTTHEDVRAQVQVLFESHVGEGAQDLAESCRTYFAHESTIQTLLAAGVSLVQEPGQVRPADFKSDGYTVNAAFFELPIRFRKETADPVAAKKTTSVRFSGDASGASVPEQTISAP